MRDVIGRHNNINMPLARWGIIVVSSCLEVYLDIVSYLSGSEILKNYW